METLTVSIGPFFNTYVTNYHRAFPFSIPPVLVDLPVKEQICDSANELLRTLHLVLASRKPHIFPTSNAAASGVPVGLPPSETQGAE